MMSRECASKVSVATQAPALVAHWHPGQQLLSIHSSCLAKVPLVLLPSSKAGAETVPYVLANMCGSDTPSLNSSGRCQ